jgi:broad specificity phosphatase PhoE
MNMPPSELKADITRLLWETAASFPEILSATLTGSFVESHGLEGVSDIDLVVITSHLDQPLFARIQASFDAALRPLLSAAGWDLRLNPTFGPLKLNDERTAVLHLMVYSRDAHIDHGVRSPFTVLDWQRSPHARPRTMAQVYPVFGLQPRHFFGGRRSASDYLADLAARRVSYRELEFGDSPEPRQATRARPMGDREAHEFGFHIVRFLMLNLVKLVSRRNESLPDEPLLAAYHAAFPDNERENRALFASLAARKRSRDFADPDPELLEKVERFVRSFERQFRTAFETDAARAVFFRHARTGKNQGVGGAKVFLGRDDPPILPLDERWPADEPTGPAAVAAAITPERVFSSPMRRCRESLALVRAFAPIPPETTDDRLREIGYGDAEGLTVEEARSRFPELVRAWDRREDPPYPGGGESSADVLARARSFASDLFRDRSSALVCTHNVVLRCMLADALGVPLSDSYRLSIPHLAPLAFVRTRFGVFADLDPAIERALFKEFAWRATPPNL